MVYYSNGASMADLITVTTVTKKSATSISTIILEINKCVNICAYFCSCVSLCCSSRAAEGSEVSDARLCVESLSVDSLWFEFLRVEPLRGESL